MWRFPGSGYHLQPRAAYSGDGRAPIIAPTQHCGSRAISASGLAGLLTSGIGVAVLSASIMKPPFAAELWGAYPPANIGGDPSESRTSNPGARLVQSVLPLNNVISSAMIPGRSGAEGLTSSNAPALPGAAVASRAQDATLLSETRIKAPRLLGSSSRPRFQEPLHRGTTGALSVSKEGVSKPPGVVIEPPNSPVSRPMLRSRETADETSPAFQPLGSATVEVIAPEAANPRPAQSLAGHDDSELSVVRQSLTNSSAIATDALSNSKEGRELAPSRPEAQGNPPVDERPNANSRSETRVGPALISPSIQTSQGVEFAVHTKINGAPGGTLALLLADTELGRPQYLANNISIRLGDIIELLGSRMQPEFARQAKSSTAAQQYVTLNDLRSQGIVVSFDDDDRLVFKVR